MNELIYRLLKDIKSSDENVRGNAITDIALILEMNTKKLSRSEREARYEGLINPDLLNVDLSDSDQVHITEALEDEIIRFNESTVSLLCAIGSASSKASLVALLKIISNISSRFDENMSYQALTSLERILFFDNNGLSEKEKSDIVSSFDPIPFIESQAVLSDRLDETAQRLLDGLHKMLQKN